MPRSVPALLWTLSLCVSSSLAGEAPEGFVSLFNGEDLTGWCGREQVDPVEYRNLPDEEKEARQTKADADLAEHWSVEDEQIVNDGHGVFCTTVDDYGDFELLIDWKMVDPNTDSGVYLRGCPQVQIWDPSDPSKKQHGGHLGSGALWNNNPGSPGKDPLALADRPVGEWNTLKIRMVGDRVTVHMNNVLVVDDAEMHNYFDRQGKLPERGPIQLQTHGGEMRFRNIYLRPLDGEAAE
ncbi:hypothetical protein Pla123a_19080 [Posidoniimonas polymericola]|uniref:3-keto-alpha-glucoside-1,2-lyase/3-keto-2-hydroxy-glucal hydratase domain-containing protein n=1 Tax=Posidoniimonas polymericola TaxID=2528002 RepID=A0A5C5YQP6_9BACT|nr:DUF1080 domain-containing protein [Posidoniimonas polymericola]TWT77251.1 hypothetical protein Pla123a_19080 [Posidoniimonas polymericola]